MMLMFVVPLLLVTRNRLVLMLLYVGVYLAFYVLQHAERVWRCSGVRKFIID